MSLNGQYELFQRTHRCIADPNRGIVGEWAIAIGSTREERTQISGAGLNQKSGC